MNYLIKKRLNKFCNHVCSGLYNRPKRKHSLETKEKISKSLKTSKLVVEKRIIRRNLYLKTVEKTICVVCGNLTKNKRKTCSSKCYSKLISDVALKNSCFHGNKNKNSFWYISSKNGRVFVESKWELYLIKDLDLNDISWIKPKHFKWIDTNNKIRRYFPDFYLPDFDLYVEPKNPYILQFDRYKLDYVITKYNIKLLVISNEQNLNFQFIKNHLLG